MEDKSALRTRRFHNLVGLVRLYKSQILSFLEYRTPGILHAAPSTISRVDMLQEKILQEISISCIRALIDFNLAPLSCRRAMSMLGVIHRSVLGQRPPHFHIFFQPAENIPRRRMQVHSKFLNDNFRCLNRDYINRSLVGYIRVYNLLPQQIINCTSVPSFQHSLQRFLKDCALHISDWQNIFSPSIALNKHPLYRR